MWLFALFLDTHFARTIRAVTMLRLQFLSLFASLALAASRTTAPSGALVVGGEGSYSAIQEAVDALDSSTSSEQIIFINPGTYTEQVYIQQLSGPLTVYGYTEDDGSYGSNQVEVTGSKSQVCRDDGAEFLCGC